MKHYLSMLCFAFMSFFFINKAAASLLLKQNPTPLEPVSFAVSEESYQVARVTWLPDYLENNKGHGGKRTDDGGRGSGDRSCETFGYASRCADGSSGTKVSPIAGMICYKNCKSCSDFGKVGQCHSGTILAPGAKSVSPVAGLNCYNFCDSCKCPDEYKYRAGGYTCTLGGNVCRDCYHSSFGAVYTQCTCGSQYKYLGEPNAVAVIGDRTYTNCFPPATVGGSSCSFPGTGGYKLTTGSRTTAIKLYTECTCPSGYTFSNGTCVDNCADYPLTVCPTGGNCSKCPDNANKLKLDSCIATCSPTLGGWQKSGNTCVAKACPAGYTAGVTTCDSNSTKPNYKQSSCSGGKVCGMCTCDNGKCEPNDCPTELALQGTCQKGEYEASCFEINGKNCCKCKEDTCSSRFPDSVPSGQCAKGYENDTLKGTLSDGTKCYTCKKEECPSSNPPEGLCPTDKAQGKVYKKLSDGTACHYCVDCQGIANGAISKPITNQYCKPVTNDFLGVTCYLCGNDAYSASNCSQYNKDGYFFVEENAPCPAGRKRSEFHVPSSNGKETCYQCNLDYTTSGSNPNPDSKICSEGYTDVSFSAYYTGKPEPIQYMRGQPVSLYHNGYPSKCAYESDSKKHCWKLSDATGKYSSIGGYIAECAGDYWVACDGICSTQGFTGFYPSGWTAGSDTCGDGNGNRFVGPCTCCQIGGGSNAF